MVSGHIHVLFYQVFSLVLKGIQLDSDWANGIQCVWRHLIAIEQKIYFLSLHFRMNSAAAV